MRHSHNEGNNAQLPGLRQAIQDAITAREAATQAL